MAALNENSIAKLITTSAVNLAANATIYVVPTGKTLIPTSVTVRSATAGATLAQNYNFGSLPSTFGFATGQSFAGLTTTLYYQMVRVSNATVYQTISAGNNFGMAVISGATGVTSTVDLFGYLV